MLRPKAFEHIGIIVADLDRSLRFYTEGLGLELLRRRGTGSRGSAALKAGDTEINVFCNADSTVLGSDEPQKIDHLCLSMETASIADLILALREVEISIASGPVERSDGTALFVRDPDGIRVELLVKR